MKNSIFALMVACSASAAAGEPSQPVAPPVAAIPDAPPATDPLNPPWMLGDVPQRLPDGSFQLPDGRLVKPGPPVTQVSPRAGTCYFIRTLRPVVPDQDAQRSGFIPLQARVLGTVSEPTCANGGTLQRLIPVQRALLKTGN